MSDLQDLGRPNELDKFKDLFNIKDAKDVNTVSDTLLFYRANIYKVMGSNDDRLQVRPLPFFVNIDKDEEKNLPKYPPLFKGETVTGLSEELDGDKCDQVAIIATADFQIGYVLGRMNVFGETSSTSWPHSYNFREVKKFLSQRHCLPEDFSYSNIDVLKWSYSSKGGSIILYNHQTGDYTIMNSSGSILTVQQKKIYMRVGTPPDPPELGPAAFSAITMTQDKVHIKSPNIELDGKDIVFGHHNLNLVGTGTSMSILGTNGTSAHAISNIHV